MPENLVPEEGGTVEGFTTDGIPTASLMIPARRIPTEVFYVTPPQLDQLKRDSEASSLHFGLWTLAAGILATLFGSLATTFEDIRVRHPNLAVILSGLCFSALLFGIVEFVLWWRSKAALASIVRTIRDKQK